MMDNFNLLSGEKNPHQRTNEETARTCPKHGQGIELVQPNSSFCYYLYFGLLLSYAYCLSFWQQTNTADMLDLAVEYIKDLQKQFKVRKESSEEIFLVFNEQFSILIVIILFYFIFFCSLAQTLSNNRANCKCLSMQKPIPNQVV